MKVFGDILKHSVLLVIVLLGGFIYLSPTPAERMRGMEEPSLAAEVRKSMLEQDLPSSEVAAERAKSFAWISSPYVIKFELTVRKVTNPLFYSIGWTFGRIVHKAGLPESGFKNFMAILGIGVAIIIVLGISVKPLLKLYAVYVNSNGKLPLSMGLLSGFVLGLSQIWQSAAQWYFIPFIGYCIGAGLLFLTVAVIISCLCEAKWWAVLLPIFAVCGFVMGFVGAFVASMTIILVFIVVLGLFLICGSISMQTQPKEKARLSDGTIVEKEYGDTWKDDSGRTWTNTYGNTFERED